jgi:hypothetical protein
LCRQRAVEPEGRTLGGALLGRRGGPQHYVDRIAWCEVQQEKRERHDADHDGKTGEQTMS